MAEVILGKLFWRDAKGEKQAYIHRPTKKNPEGAESRLMDLTQLDDRLKNRTDEVEVDLELEAGQMVRIRPTGEAWQGASPTSPQSERTTQRQGGYQQGGQGRNPNPNPVRGEFHNPYNFIPTPSRDNAANELSDRCPVGHHRYLADHYSGSIDVTVETKTPLLIPDTSRPEVLANGHKIFRTLRGPDGRPYLHPAGIRGALRSAYEAVTNSRYGVFQKHDAPHGYRMTTQEGLKLVPAIVENGNLVLLTGSKTVGANGPLYGAWLPLYRTHSMAVNPRYAAFAHRTHVWACIKMYQHDRKPFSFWSVENLLPFDKHRTPTGGPEKSRWVEGWVCRTEKNIDNKHDERVFFVDAAVRKPPIPLSPEDHKNWKHLIENYQTIHSEEIRAGKTGPPALNNAVWSRHVTGGDAERELSNGTLCYARVERAGGGYRILALYPVNISREIHPNAPDQLLDSSLKPAADRSQLSPADRVFGWVNRKGPGAYGGQLRVESVRCDDPDAIEEFGGDGVPLAILGAPKSQQVRFYVGDANGNPLPDGDQPRYTAGDKALRGRKVYLHDRRLAADYWQNPTQDRTQPRDANERHQEYRKPSGEKERDDQNRSMRDWVKVETRFTFRLRVRNLSDVELGALLWLLTLPEDHHLRFGGGKPLGFGCVHLSIADMRLRSGEQIKDDYKNAFSEDRSATRSVYPDKAKSVPEGDRKICDLVGVYEKAVSDAYKKPFEQVPFIKALLVSVKGFSDGLPVHYPRVRTEPGNCPVPPHADGENFKWFGKNEASDKRSLPPLIREGGLPYYLVLPRRD